MENDASWRHALFCDASGPLNPEAKISAAPSHGDISTFLHKKNLPRFGVKWLGGFFNSALVSPSQGRSFPRIPGSDPDDWRTPKALKSGPGMSKNT